MPNMKPLAFALLLIVLPLLAACGGNVLPPLVVHPAKPLPPPKVALPRIVTDKVVMPWCLPVPNTTSSSPTPSGSSGCASGANR